ncbi:hypothetical protein DPSP01_001083 [Paraphaeosphaeria sporulosa]
MGCGRVARTGRRLRYAKAARDEPNGLAVTILSTSCFAHNAIKTIIGPPDGFVRRLSAPRGHCTPGWKAAETADERLCNLQSSESQMR